MAYLRAAGVFATLIAFFVIGAPVQWLILRFRLPFAQALPLAFNRILLGLLQIKVVVHDLAAKRGEDVRVPQLLVANHVSWTDVPALGTIRSISFLAKREVAGWPIIASFARLQGTIFVDRKSRRSIREANAEMAQRMLHGGWVALFPEGTTYDGSALGQFHSSHFAAVHDLLLGAPNVAAVRVQPVAIRYSAPHAAWLGDALLVPHILQLVKGEPVVCDLFFCAPLLVERASNRKLIATQCTEIITARLAAPKEGATPEPALCGQKARLH